MASKETRRQRGRRRGLELAAHTLAELRTIRVTSDVSMEALARQLDCSQSSVSRRISSPTSVTLVGLSEMAAVLGMELSVRLYPVGDPIRDKGHQALGRRFDALIGPAWSSTAEALLPGQGGLRAWDRLLRLIGAAERHLVGVDLETRIRDVQELVRRTRLRERDGGVDHIVIVLSDSATNRRLVDQLRDALGSDYGTSPRQIMSALREGRPLPGSAVILV